MPDVNGVDKAIGTSPIWAAQPFINAFFEELVDVFSAFWSAEGRATGGCCQYENTPEKQDYGELSMSAHRVSGVETSAFRPRRKRPPPFLLEPMTQVSVFLQTRIRWRLSLKNARVNDQLYPTPEQEKQLVREQ
jgi:hypothetical protein